MHRQDGHDWSCRNTISNPLGVMLLENVCNETVKGCMIYQHQKVVNPYLAISNSRQLRISS